MNDTANHTVSCLASCIEIKEGKFRDLGCTLWPWDNKKPPSNQSEHLSILVPTTAQGNTFVFIIKIEE